jgi:hypothetical protein
MSDPYRRINQKETTMGIVPDMMLGVGHVPSGVIDWNLGHWLAGIVSAMLLVCAIGIVLDKERRTRVKLRPAPRRRTEMVSQGGGGYATAG